MLLSNISSLLLSWYYCNLLIDASRFGSLFAALYWRLGFEVGFFKRLLEVCTDEILDCILLASEVLFFVRITISIGVTSLITINLNLTAIATLTTLWLFLRYRVFG